MLYQYNQGMAHPQPEHGYYQGQPNLQQGGGFQQGGNFQQDGGFQQPASGFQQPASGFQQFAQGGTGLPPGFAAPFAQQAFAQGNQYLQLNLGKYINQSELHGYFQVSTAYVLRKIALVLFPYRHGGFAREVRVGEDARESYPPPVADINAPDLYIPLMGFVTYVLLWSVVSGLKGEFHPDQLGYTATTAFALSVLDVLVLKLGIYLVGGDSRGAGWWDLVALVNYKFVPIITVVLVRQVLGLRALVHWGVLAGVFPGYAWFLLKLVSSGTVKRGRGKELRRPVVQYLLVHCFVLELFVFIICVGW